MNEEGSSAAATTGSAIEVRDLRRVYPRRGVGFRAKKSDFVALHGVDLDVPAGEVHGLLGPNGAGKSTLCKILSTVLVPTSGTAKVMGYDVQTETARIRPIISLVLGGERGLYSRLTARQNLRFWAALYGCSDREADVRSDALLDRVGLLSRRNDRVETFSRGMKQRVHLARGLLSDPKVILLDEPTTGMDPIATRDFQTLIREIRKDRTILLATHDMTEAETLCDRVSLIQDGRIIATETPQTLASWITRYERIDIGTVGNDLVRKIRELSGVGRVEPGADGGIRVETVAENAARDVIQLLLEHGHTEIRTSLPSLEEVYLQLLGPHSQAAR